VEEFQQATEGIQQAAEKRRGLAQGYGFEECGSR
jgi:hypothetical protein